MRWLKEGQKQENGDIMVVGEPSILHSAAGHYVGQLYLHFYKDMRPDEQGIPMPYDRLSEYFPNEESAAPLLESIRQACLRPRDRFWDIPVPKIDSAFDNLLVPQPSWSPSTTQQL
ncbi:hypothetical protein, partial [Thiolapillus sp.]|uniref:hypothetical protein n=1 Tax=Thiolapillus sp. TaxID=2017437 RepID=UPI0025ED06FF